MQKRMSQVINRALEIYKNLIFTQNPLYGWIATITIAVSVYYLVSFFGASTSDCIILVVLSILPKLCVEAELEDSRCKQASTNREQSESNSVNFSHCQIDTSVLMNHQGEIKNRISERERLAGMLSITPDEQREMNGMLSLPQDGD